MTNRTVHPSRTKHATENGQEDASQRIRDMDVLIRWEGELSNSRIREVFGVQAVQASRLLAAYIAERGSSITRSSPRAPIKPSMQFDKEVPQTSADDYLRLLSGTVGSLCSTDSVIEARSTLSSEDPQLFAALLKAIHSTTGLRITYGSMNQPDGAERVIFPHSLVRAPRRWHVRAWCDLRKEFRDFAMGRVLSFQSLSEPAPRVRRHDVDWSKFVTLKIVAHPEFEEAHQRLLRREYFSGRLSMALKVRRALASYVVQDLRLATDLARDRPPHFQLYLENNQSLSDLFSVG